MCQENPETETIQLLVIKNGTVYSINKNTILFQTWKWRKPGSRFVTSD